VPLRYSRKRNSPLPFLPPKWIKYCAEQLHPCQSKGHKKTLTLVSNASGIVKYKNIPCIWYISIISRSGRFQETQWQLCCFGRNPFQTALSPRQHQIDRCLGLLLPARKATSLNRQALRKRLVGGCNGMIEWCSQQCVGGPSHTQGWRRSLGLAFSCSLPYQQDIYLKAPTGVPPHPG